LNAEGHRNRAGREWSPQMVHHVLRAVTDTPGVNGYRPGLKGAMNTFRDRTIRVENQPRTRWNSQTTMVTTTETAQIAIHATESARGTRRRSTSVSPGSIRRSDIVAPADGGPDHGIDGTSQYRYRLDTPVTGISVGDHEQSDTGGRVAAVRCARGDERTPSPVSVNKTRQHSATTGLGAE